MSERYAARGVPSARDRARFEAKVDRSPGQGPHGDCHLWTAVTNENGYGQFWFEGRMRTASRVAWLLETGRWPEPCALHTCDTPACIRFAHLFEGTHRENMDDRDTKGRNTCAWGSRNASAKLTDEQRAEVLALRGMRSQRQIARQYGISQPAVGKIHRRGGM